jgi:hypothetical protein
MSSLPELRHQALDYMAIRKDRLSRSCLAIVSIAWRDYHYLHLWRNDN